MSKIQKNQRILMINLPFSGHVNPTLPLAECLVKRGHSVDYICTEQFRQKIENTGASFIPYSSFPKDRQRMKRKSSALWQRSILSLNTKVNMTFLSTKCSFTPE